MSKENLSTVYLDNNATTELSQDAAAIVMDMVINNIYGNPSSSHQIGTRIMEIVHAARYGVALSLNCGIEEVIFTSGGTESNNIALRGTYSNHTDAANDIVISAGEHSSVNNTTEAIANEGKIRFIPLRRDGTLDLGWADRLITEDTALVSVMLANNETGVIFPVKEIVKIAHSRGALVHCDAVQVYGKMPIDVRSLGVDLLSISGHKAHSLSGTGALYIRKGVLIHPIMTGGRQEGAARAGTENYIGIASLGTIAGELAKEEDYLEAGLRDAFETGITKRVKGIKINGCEVPRISNTSSITIKGVHAQSLVTALSELGVMISAGPACSSGSVKPSRTLKAMGLTDEDALSTVRVSFGKLNTFIDCSIAIEAFVKCIRVLRQSSGEVEVIKPKKGE